MLAHMDIGLGNFVLMIAPFLLLPLALAVIFLRSWATALLGVFATSLVLICIYGEPWRIPTKLWDQPFVQSWYYCVWFDLLLLPMLGLWLYFGKKTNDRLAHRNQEQGDG